MFANNAIVQEIKMKYRWQRDRQLSIKNWQRQALMPLSTDIQTKIPCKDM